MSKIKKFQLIGFRQSTGTRVEMTLSMDNTNCISEAWKLERAGFITKINFIVAKEQ